MPHWWQTGIIYHIYPRSFQDSNGDGIGDLPGIMQRLDYLQWLGIDAIWLSPIYPSPMADFGYDVSDYTNIHPMFGTLEELDALLMAIHQRQMRLILDFVPNHTSDQHPWFQEARQSRENPRRDWYYWRDPAPDGGPPNNWLSRFDGKSAWEWDEATGQYYLHTFLKEQPDLNWRNPEVRAAMLDVMRFWFDRGVDGLRVDVSYRVMKDAAMRDNPVNANWQRGLDPSFRLIEKHTKNTPDIHLFNRWLREVADEYDDRVLVGEMNLPLPQLVTHYGTAVTPEFHLPFNFRLIFTPWEADNVRQLADEYDALLPAHGWPNWVLSNHDQPRFTARAGQVQARNGLLFLLTMRGTPTVYYGEEIGMENGPIPLDRVQDPWELLTPGLGLGRDPERTPMQWDGTTHAGFCDPEAMPWLPVNPNATVSNVEAQQKVSDSILTFVKRLIQLRRGHEALQIGSYLALPADPPLFVYERRSAHARCLIVLNLSDHPQTWTPPPSYSSSCRLLLSTCMDQPECVHGRSISVRANEGLLLGIMD